MSADLKILHFLDKNMSKKLRETLFRNGLAFDKVYLSLYLYDIFPELGSTLWYCIEALSVSVETAEGWYASKTLLRRAGQYPKCNAYRHRVRPSKRLKDKRTCKTMSISGLTCA